MSMMRWVLLGVISLPGLLSGCDQPKKPTAGDGGQQQQGQAQQGQAQVQHHKGAAPAKAQAPAAADGESAKPAAALSDDAKQQGKCPEGTWFYDYASLAKELIFAGVPNVKVTKSTGKFSCKLEGLSPGSMTCTSDPAHPVHIEASAEQMGMPLIVTMKMSGSSSSKYEQLKPGVLKVTDDDFSKLKVVVSASVAGREMELPLQDWHQAFGVKGHNLLYWCEGPDLYLRGDFDELKDLRARMTPVP